MSVIVARELSKWFGEVVALNSVDIEIGPGVTGLLGPNGAGKSTFIKLTLGLHAPSRGYIHVFGEPPRNNPRVLQRIGYCPETDRFHDNVSGYEFVYWMSRLWGMTPKMARAATEAAIERMGMTERMHDPLTEYSKGMRQRIKLAQALATGPDLLFLDEPMIGLDPQGREEMFRLIKSLGEEGLAVVVSSHILHEIERATDYIVLLYNGVVLASGNVREVRRLLDKHPHAIQVTSPDVRGVAAAFAGNKDVASIEFGDGRITLRTHNPAATYAELNQRAAEGALVIESLVATDDDLQSIFEYLVR